MRFPIQITLPKPAEYPFWFRLVIVVMLAMFVVILFFFLAPTAAFITWSAQHYSMKDTLAGLGALAGSFFGAWLAFRFARIQRDRDRVETEVAAGRRALFTLYQMWNALKQHQTEAGDLYRKRDDAWLNFPAYQPLSARPLIFDLKEISFIDATILQKIVLEEQRFALAAYMIDRHRTLVLSQVFPRLSALGLQVGGQAPLDAVERALSVGVVHELKTLTAGIINNVDEDVISSFAAFRELRAHLRDIFPGRKWPQLDPHSANTAAA